MTRILRQSLAAGAGLAMWLRVQATLSAEAALETVRLAGPTVAIELADETRPVAFAPEAQPGGALAVRAPLPPLAAGSRVVATAGVAPPGEMPTSAWRLELALWPQSDATRAQSLAERIIDPAAQSGDGRWHLLEAPLPGPTAAGSMVVLTAQPTGGVPVGTPPRLGMPRALTPPREATGRRNVILISLDTLRADRLSISGAERPTSPALDALARQGVHFRTALAPSPSTPPSHMTMLTGTHPCRHGIFGIHVEDRLPDDLETLAEILARNGYTTAAITENAYVGAPYGFTRGFDSFREIKQKIADGNSPAPGVITPTGYGPVTFAAANDWLRQHHDQRFFLFVHTYQMHGPRRPTEPYTQFFRDEAGPEPSPSPGFDPAFHDRTRYDQLLRQVDDLVASLLQTLEELHLTSDTILVVTSDHGEAFFEHDDHGHGFSLWEETTRVPLILSAPGLAKPRAIDEPVSLADIVPTVLDLIGIAVPSGLDGQSYAPQVTGAVEETPSPGSSERAIYMETALGNASAARDGRYKVIREENGRERLFDLAEDPRETRDLTGSAAEAEIPQERLARLRTVLDRGGFRCRMRREELAKARTGAAALDPERRDKLRALGYAE